MRERQKNLSEDLTPDRFFCYNLLLTGGSWAAVGVD